MTHFKLAFLGFGNVGQALADLLIKKEAEINSRYGITFTITGIATGHHGSAIDVNGIDIGRSLHLMRNHGSLDELSRDPSPPEAFDFIQRCQADVLFENTPVNYESGQPAVDHLQLALQLGMHAITANKGPVVHAYDKLTRLAASKGRKFYFESAVMDGAPVFSTFREALPGAKLLSFIGILNSTTNLILTRMEAGEEFEGAVAYAQEIGIAETDPSGDLDGWDAAVKVAALVTVLMGVPVKPDQVERTGIRAITSQDIRDAGKIGQRWKLACSAQRDGDQVRTLVAPQLVNPDSPLFHVNGTSSVIQFETDVLASLSLIEADPGPHTTAYGLLADFLNAARE